MKIKYTVTTKSNCLIGNQTSAFSIGGVDQCTTLDENGKPIIHGSAMKGALRNIFRKECINNDIIKDFIKDFLNKEKDKYSKLLKQMDEKSSKNIESIKKIITKISNLLNDVKAEYIFGIEGLNDTPRLFFSDLRVIDLETEDYFLIDTKTSIEEINGELISNPRTYKVVKPGIKFEGNIILKIDSDDEKIKDEIKAQLEKFNEEYYRIGNSKSRGYGIIAVEIEND